MNEPSKKCATTSCKTMFKAVDPHTHCLLHTPCFSNHVFDPRFCQHCNAIFDNRDSDIAQADLWKFRIRRMRRCLTSEDAMFLHPEAEEKYGSSSIPRPYKKRAVTPRPLSRASQEDPRAPHSPQGALDEFEGFTEDPSEPPTPAQTPLPPPTPDFAAMFENLKSFVTNTMTEQKRDSDARMQALSDRLDQQEQARDFSEDDKSEGGQLQLEDPPPEPYVPQTPVNDSPFFFPV